jgi:hypothetical protein
MKNEVLYAYLAGAIDSDGTIGVKKSTYAMRVTKDSKQPTYSERVALRQVESVVPNLLKRTFGGSLYITKPSAPRGRPLWSWAATDIRAVECLRHLLPYLMVKSCQARNALSLRVLKDKSRAAKVRFGRGHVGAAPRPKRLGEAMEMRYLKAKKLNRVGI